MRKYETKIDQNFRRNIKQPSLSPRSTPFSFLYSSRGSERKRNKCMMGVD
jgi:hypothetical protein